ncbi:MAG: DUF4458 domain-containing protein [Candidatus Cryptobacteroides sp.]
MILLSLLVFSTALFTGCGEDEVDNPAEGYGYVQFHLYKSASYTKAANELDFLSDAAKLRVSLRTADNDILTPTVTVSSPDKSLAEWGMQSDKFELVAGDYVLTSYQVLDALDSPIFTGTPSEEMVINVVRNGLVYKDLLIDVVERGFVNFTLVKDIPETKGTGVDKHPFYMITSADITVRNTLTHERETFTGIKFRHTMGIEDGYTTAVSKSDSLVNIKAGTYEVVSFVTYFDASRSVRETCDNVAANKFTVEDNKTSAADVPVTFDLTADYLKDAIAIKKIWEALDGPNWKVKWDFDCDVDLWTAQSGIQIHSDGRVATLNLAGLGAKGAVPAEIGDLEELRILQIGTHEFDPGESPVKAKGLRYTAYSEAEQLEVRDSFRKMYVANSDPRSIFPEEMRLAFELAGDPYRESEGTLRPYPSSASDPSVNYASGITSLPPEINKLKKLQYLYIAYAPLTSLPDDMSGLEAVTDAEFFYLPEMTEFPKGLKTMPKIQMLAFSSNSGVSSQEMYDGLADFCTGAAAKTLQGLYIPNNNIEVLPDLRPLERLSVLNVQYCGLKKFEAPFGKSHYFNQFYAGGNELTSLPVDENGYFFGIDYNTETISFTDNKFTELPDMFEASSIHTMGTFDFSFNQISECPGFNGGQFRGINCEILNLSYNKLKKFPRWIGESGSRITYLQLQGNGMEEIEEEALNGENLQFITTLDISRNCLSKLPSNFTSRTFHYLQAIDMSYNRFDAFPYGAANNQYLHVFIFRHQRDANGNRCMKEWPSGIGSGLYGLRALYLGSNDLRVINDKLSYLIYNLDISDNPNIVLDVSNICPYIAAGMFNLIYSPDQDIRGCDDYLNLNK